MVFQATGKTNDITTPEETKRPGFQDFVHDNWVWDAKHKAEDVLLSSDCTSAYFNVDPVEQTVGTTALRGCHGFADGEHYWEVIFLEPPSGSSVMVGVGTADTKLCLEESVNLIGMDAQSWGLSYKGQTYHGGKGSKYCEPFFAQNTVIGVHLDLNQGRLTFYKDGRSLGVAFTGIRASRQHRLYPMISSTASETELGVGKRVRRLAQPAGLGKECVDVIRECVRCVDDVDSLPLPSIVKKYIMET